MGSELTHRAKGELAAALASMNMALASHGSPGGETLLRCAISRLEGFGSMLDAMAVLPEAPVDLAQAIEAMSENLWKGRASLRNAILVVASDAACVKPSAARVIMTVAHQLVQSSIECMVDGREGVVAIVLRTDGRDIQLDIEDSGEATRIPGRIDDVEERRPICDELLRRAGGRIHRSYSIGGRRVRVRLPSKGAIIHPARE
ncbi:MAG: hypothetical protein KGJ57_19315 [Sphingomonadales bacterium]|nr:hypothetical protein [Sphingomonadales bacterium]MDE2171545.1 hypothetical protein [Sphingomonadales bacterium]